MANLAPQPARLRAETLQVTQDIRYAFDGSPGAQASRSSPSCRSGSELDSTRPSSRWSMRCSCVPFPVRSPARLVNIYTSGADGDTYSSNSLPDLLDYRAGTAAFEDVAGYSPMFAGVSRGDRSRLVLGEVVTGNYFAMLGVPARLGRTLLPDDDRPPSAPVVVVSHRYWQREFGGDINAIGSTLRIRGQQFSVVGVVDDGFSGMVPMLAPKIWTPVRHAEEIEPAGINETVPSPTGTSRAGSPRPAMAVRQSATEEGHRPSSRRARRWTSLPHASAPNIRRPTRNAASRSGRPATARLHPEADRILTWVVTGHDAGGRVGPGHCLRQCRRDAPGARVRPAAGSQHQTCRRRQPRAAGEAAADREPDSRTAWRDGWRHRSPPG